MRLQNAWPAFGLGAAFILGACSAPGTAPLAPPSLTTPSLGLPLRAQPIAPRVDRSASWMASDAAGSDLLYVSDVGSGDVNVYTYPGGKLRGQLTGFRWPSGLCVDKAGDVYVPDLFSAEIVEYRHGAAKPMRVLKDTYEDPGDCSVDPMTGNLAVANVSTPYSNPGDVLIYTKAKGKPKVYHDQAIAYYEFCTYDNYGNLYVDGTLTGNFALTELLRGQKSFTSLTVNQTFSYPGAVQWDGKYLAVGDYEAKQIYQFSIGGGEATEVGITHLRGSNYPVAFWIEGKTVIAPNDQGASTMFWNYPAGGFHTKLIRGLDKPWGVTVSSKS